MADLVPKQRRFIAEYLADPKRNATQAAVKAGYSVKTADRIGSKLLKDPRIDKEISEKLSKIFEKLDITAEVVLQEIATLAFANMADYVTISPSGEATVDLSKMTRQQAAAVLEITVDEVAGGSGDGVRERVKRTRFKLADKGMNLERLGRHLKLFTDKSEVEHKYDHTKLTDQELDRQIAELERKLGLDQPPAPDLSTPKPAVQ